MPNLCWRRWPASSRTIVTLRLRAVGPHVMQDAAKTACATPRFLLTLQTHSAEQTRVQLAVADELGKVKIAYGLPARRALIAACVRNGLLADAERLLKEGELCTPRDELAQQWFCACSAVR